jgi:replicative DNA helicase
MNEEELAQIMKYYDRGYTYSCANPEKSSQCDTQCYLYKVKEMGDESIFKGKDYVDRYLKSLKEDKSDWLYLNTIYPELTVSPLKPSHGHIVIIVGGSSSGKTTLVDNLMWKMNRPCLFFSYDMAGLSFTEGMFKLADVDMDNKQSLQDFSKRMENIITCDNSTVNIKELPKVYKAIVDKTNVRPKYVIIDYIQQVPVHGGNAMERAITISKQFKQFAKEEKVVIIALSQVPKEIAGDGDRELGMNSPKDSGEITNLADMVLAVWRPEKGKGVNKHESMLYDKIMRVNIAKDKYSPADYQVDLHWAGNHKVKSPKKGG